MFSPKRSAQNLCIGSDVHLCMGQVTTYVTLRPGNSQRLLKLECCCCSSDMLAARQLILPHCGSQKTCISLDTWKVWLHSPICRRDQYKCEASLSPQALSFAYKRQQGQGLPKGLIWLIEGHSKLHISPEMQGSGSGTRAVSSIP